jgi:hypothetical protein
VSEREVAELAETLFTGYASYLAALDVARHPASEVVVRAMAAEKQVLTAIRSKDGIPVFFETIRYLRQAQERDDFQLEYERAWLVGALLTLGDRLGDEDYFDHAPELELVFHLRNGVAHGNRFDVRGRELRWRAHLYGKFEITPELHGRTVLFDFMDPGDVFQVFAAVRQHLRGMQTR